ncbi:MAG: hypothetical protein V4621_03820 [Pseudomonadota bacterium]
MTLPLLSPANLSGTMAPETPMTALLAYFKRQPTGQTQISKARLVRNGGYAATQTIQAFNTAFAHKADYPLLDQALVTSQSYSPFTLALVSIFAMAVRSLPSAYDVPHTLSSASRRSMLTNMAIKIAETDAPKHVASLTTHGITHYAHLAALQPDAYRQYTRLDSLSHGFVASLNDTVAKLPFDHLQDAWFDQRLALMHQTRTLNMDHTRKYTSEMNLRDLHVMVANCDGPGFGHIIEASPHLVSVMMANALRVAFEAHTSVEHLAYSQHRDHDRNAYAQIGQIGDQITTELKECGMQSQGLYAYEKRVATMIKEFETIYGCVLPPTVQI